MNEQNNQHNMDMLHGNEREILLRRIVDEFPDNLFTALFVEGVMTSLSIGAGVAELIGYDPEELRTEPELWLDIVHPADDIRIRKAFARLATGKPLNEVYRIFHKTGQMKWIRISAVATKDTELYHIIGIASDASAEKPSERLTQYKQLLDQAPTPVSLRASNGRMIYCNQAYAALIGYMSVEEAMLVEMRDVIPPDDIEWFEQEILPRISTEPWQGEVRLMRKDGQIRNVSVSTNAVYGPDDEPTGFYAVFTDITQRKITEQALRESEEKYRNLVERSNDGIVVIQDATIRFVNERFAEMVSYSVEQLIGAEFVHCITSDDVALLRDRYTRRMAGEKIPQIYEVQLTRSDSSTIYVEVNAGLITYEGKPADLVLFRDVTQRKHDEQTLRESEEKFRTLVENIDAVIFQIDPEMRILTAEGQISNWIGLPANELIRDRSVWRHFISVQDLQKLQAAMTRAREKKSSETVEIKVKHKSGNERWVRGQITPRFDGSGNLIYYDAVGIDITEQVEAVELETRHAHLIAALVDMSQVFISTLDMNKIISTAVKSTASQLDCVCSMLELDHDSGLLHHMAIYSENKEFESSVYNAFEGIGITIRDIFDKGEVRPELFADLKIKSERSVEFAQKTGIESPVTVPLYVEGELFGVFAGSRKRDEQPFDDEDFWFMNEVAIHVSAALTNATLYKRQARIAETLQRSLIPEGIKMPGQDTATSYLPAKGDVEIGGDFFDIIDFGDIGVGVIVGDVSGKGLDAAIHTAEAKYMLRGFVRQNPDPGFVMTNLNYALWTYMSEFTFVTMFYALIDPKKCLMKYVNAGHECPLILCRNTRRIREVCPNGIILGIERNADYNSTQIHLGSDEFLFCYTDGLIDAPYDSDRFGYERLVKTVRKAPCTTAQELLDYVTGVVQEKSGGEQPDDQVVVVVRTCR